MKAIFGPAIAVLALGLGAPAYADNVQIYNSWSPTDTYPPGNASFISGNTQGWGQEFNSGLATMLTEVAAFVTPLGEGSSTVNVSVFNDGGTLPTGSAIWSQSGVATSGTGFDITGISAALTAGNNYWLAVLPGDGNVANWQGGNLAPNANLDSFSVTVGSPNYHVWQVAGTYTAEAAIINGSYVATSDVPEPASLALLGFGLLGTAIARRRRG